MSEKLVLDAFAAASDIIGSTATRAECGSHSSSATAAERTGLGAAWASGALTSNSPRTGAPDFESNFNSDLKSGSAAGFASDGRATLLPVATPAAATAALVPTAGGFTFAGTGATIGGATRATGLGETDGTGAAGAWGFTALDSAETNLLAAAARASGLTATFGAAVVFLESVPFLPFSLHFSRSSTSSRALW